MNDSPVPAVLAMLVCDQVIVDAMSNKKSLIGVFDNVHSTAYPTQINCSVYAKLADAEGHYLFRLKIVSLKDESSLAEVQVEGQIANRSEPAEIGAHLLGVHLPEVGAYEIQLWANDVYLSRTKLNAVLLRPGESQ